MVKSLNITFTNFYKLGIVVLASKYPNVSRRPYGTKSRVKVHRLEPCRELEIFFNRIIK